MSLTFTVKDRLEQILSDIKEAESRLNDLRDEDLFIACNYSTAHRLCSELRSEIELNLESNIF